MKQSILSLAFALLATSGAQAQFIEKAIKEAAFEATKDSVENLIRQNRMSLEQAVGTLKYYGISEFKDFLKEEMPSKDNCLTGKRIISETIVNTGTETYYVDSIVYNKKGKEKDRIRIPRTFGINRSVGLNANAVRGKELLVVGQVGWDLYLEYADPELTATAYADTIFAGDACERYGERSKGWYLHMSSVAEEFELVDYMENIRSQLSGSPLQPYDLTEPYWRWVERNWYVPEFREELKKIDMADRDGKVYRLGRVKARYWPNQNTIDAEFHDEEGNERSLYVAANILERLTELLKGREFTKMVVNAYGYLNEENLDNVEANKLAVEKVVAREDEKGNFNVYAVDGSNRYIELARFKIPELDRLCEAEGHSAAPYYWGFHKEYAPYYDEADRRDSIFMERESERIQKEEVQKDYERQLAQQKNEQFQRDRKRYGEKFAVAIRDGKIVKGMTQAMVSQAVGSIRKQVLKTEVRNGKTYSTVRFDNLLFYYIDVFEDGKVLRVVDSGM